jgi:hypothetical protein
MKSSFYTRISRQTIYINSIDLQGVRDRALGCLKRLGTDYSVKLISAKEYIEVEDVLALNTDYFELSNTKEQGPCRMAIDHTTGSDPGGTSVKQILHSGHFIFVRLGQGTNHGLRARGVTEV